MQEIVDKILVYLLENAKGTRIDGYESPSYLTVNGIAKKIGEPTSNVSILLRNLEEKRFVRSKENYVVGYSTKKDIFFLTPIGIARAATLTKNKSVKGFL